MKHRKILSVILALAMTMALAVPALAASVEVAGKDGGSLKISDATADGKVELYDEPCDLYRVPVGAVAENTDGTLSGIAVLPVVQDTDGIWKLINEDDYEGVWPAWEEGVAKRTFVAGTEGYWLAEAYDANDNIRVRFVVKVEGGSAPTQPAEPAFTDVPADEWYAEPVAWAVEKGITIGTGDDKFSPDLDCTNGEIIAFLWRAADKPTAASAAPMTVESYFQDAINWAYEQKIIDASFRSTALCTRLNAVAYIWKALNSPAAKTPASFTDTADSPAVAWAVESGVTQGTGGGKFSPDETCSRAEIVTFLYRAYAE